MEMAAAIGAAAAWGAGHAAPSKAHCRSVANASRGVASGDPDEHSVLQDTLPQRDPSARLSLHVEVAQDPSFRTSSRQPGPDIRRL